MLNPIIQFVVNSIFLPVFALYECGHFIDATFQKEEENIIVFILWKQNSFQT